MKLRYKVASGILLVFVTALSLMATLAELMQSGKVTPVIDRRFSLSEVPEAIRYSEEGHARGKIVINIQ